MTSRKRLAREVFNLDLPFLERLAKNPANYRVFSVKQGEKDRRVEMPKIVLERLHRRLFELLARIEKPDYLHSGVKGRSYITNARAHVGDVPLAKLDIRSFYPSITAAKVYRFFNKTLQCSPDVAGLLTNLCTVEGHLPTGSCVSQLLAFFAAKPMFDELHTLALGHGVCDTYYVDDMSFSGESATPSFLWRVKQVVHSHGFKYHKDRCYSAKDKKLVTGVLVDGDHLAVLPSKELDLWKSINALGGHEPEARIAAVNSLIGTVIAAGQIEVRFLQRLRRLRSMRAALLTP